MSVCTERHQFCYNNYTSSGIFYDSSSHRSAFTQLHTFSSQVYYQNCVERSCLKLSEGIYCINSFIREDGLEIMWCYPGLKITGSMYVFKTFNVHLELCVTFHLKIMEYLKNDKRTDLPLVPFWGIWHILDPWPQFWHFLLQPLFSVTLLHVCCSAVYEQCDTSMVRYADQKDGKISIHKLCNLRVQCNSPYIKVILIYAHTIRDFQHVWIHKNQLFPYWLLQVWLSTFSHDFNLLHNTLK